MVRNVGGADRAVRFTSGAVLLGSGLLLASDAKWRAAMLAGSAVALGTAAAGYCPANALLGIDTAQDSS